MGEKIYIVAQKSEPIELDFDDYDSKIDKQIEAST